MKKSGNAKKQLRSFQQPEQHRINAKIKAKEVRIIGENGEQIGIKTIQEALTLAQEANLDLVEVAPNASPPVCKLIDYGKFKYRLQKKKAEAKKNRTDNTVKELKIRYCTDKGDLDTKIKQARKFLNDGYKVKFSMRFKGRERSFIHLGQEKLEQVVENLKDIANLEERSSFTGGQLYMILSPLKNKATQQLESQQQIAS